MVCKFFSRAELMNIEQLLLGKSNFVRYNSNIRRDLEINLKERENEEEVVPSIILVNTNSLRDVQIGVSHLSFINIPNMLKFRGKQKTTDGCSSILTMELQPLFLFPPYKQHHQD